MADIAMCADDKCPSRRKCYRFIATADTYQTYGDFGRADGAGKCAHFWSADERKARRLA